MNNECAKRPDIDLDLMLKVEASWLSIMWTLLPVILTARAGDATGAPAPVSVFLRHAAALSPCLVAAVGSREGPRQMDCRGVIKPCGTSKERLIINHDAFKHDRTALAFCAVDQNSHFQTWLHLAHAKGQCSRSLSFWIVEEIFPVWKDYRWCALWFLRISLPFFPGFYLNFVLHFSCCALLCPGEILCFFARSRSGMCVSLARALVAFAGWCRRTPEQRCCVVVAWSAECSTHSA